VLGKLLATLEYAEPGEIQAQGLREYLTQIRALIAEASATVMATYFLK
jgi:hypothetical protein